jgi:hypothetical protein
VLYQKHNPGFLYIWEENPNYPQIVTDNKKEIHFPWGRLPLHRVVKSLEFMWRKCQSKRKILVERADNVAWRSRYLKETQKCQDNGCSTFYTHKTWIKSKLTWGKCWQYDEVMGIHTNVYSGNRLTMLHVEGIHEFPPNAQHIFKAGLPTGD